jgi:hypothetical protein
MKLVNIKDHIEIKRAYVKIFNFWLAELPYNKMSEFVERECYLYNMISLRQDIIDVVRNYMWDEIVHTVGIMISSGVKVEINEQN